VRFRTLESFVSEDYFLDRIYDSTFSGHGALGFGCETEYGIGLCVQSSTRKQTTIMEQAPGIATHDTGQL
jgi:hypothetical protein